MNTRRLRHVVDGPCQLITDRVIDKNQVVRFRLTLDLLIHIAESWPQQGKDIEAPIEPARKTLPLLEWIGRGTRPTPGFGDTTSAELRHFIDKIMSSCR